MPENAYRKGWLDGRYGYSNINPDYTREQLDAWMRGFEAGNAVAVLYQVEIDEAVDTAIDEMKESEREQDE